MTDHNDLPRERLARLEVEVSHMKAELRDTHLKVVEMHELLLRAKGVKWAILGMAGIAGYIASYLPKITTFISGLPK